MTDPVVERDPILDTDFIKEMVRQMRALDSYGQFDGQPVDRLLEPFVLTPERKAEISATIPLARLGRADDVAGACVFLASELAAYCTGITLDVNGGMLIH